MEKPCSKPGLLARGDLFIVAKALSQLSQVSHFFYKLSLSYHSFKPIAGWLPAHTAHSARHRLQAN